MVSRRTLLTGGVTAASFAASPVLACPAALRMFKPDARDRSRMMDGARQFRTAFNAGRAGAFLGPEADLWLHAKYTKGSAEVVKALAGFREANGKILTPVTDDSTMFRPEFATLYFISSMERSPPYDDLEIPIHCTAPDSHDAMMFAFSWNIDQRVNRIRFDRPPVLAIGAPL